VIVQSAHLFVLNRQGVTRAVYHPKHLGLRARAPHEVGAIRRRDGLVCEVRGEDGLDCADVRLVVVEDAEIARRRVVLLGEIGRQDQRLVPSTVMVF